MPPRPGAKADPRSLHLSGAGDATLPADQYFANPVHYTPRAAAEVLKIYGEQRLPRDRSYVRISIKDATGRGDFYYDMDIRDEPTDPAADYRTDSHGVVVVVNRHDAVYLAGTRIDFVTTAEGKGFVFKNPNVQS